MDGKIEFFTGEAKETLVAFSKDYGIKATVKEKVTVDAKKDIRVMSKKDIHLEADGVILHKSTKDVEIKAKCLKVKKGEISHKNLKVLE